VALLVDACRELLAEASVGWEAVAAVGVGFPGHVKEGGTVAAGAANLSEEWKAGVPLVKLLEEGFRKLVEDGGQMRPLENIPSTIVLVNDADAALAAEAWGGAAQGHKDVVMLTLGTGIGVAVWLNGQARSGSRGLVEGGHMVVEKEGRKCGCGQKGCLEMYASATAVVWRANELGFRRRPGEARKEGVGEKGEGGAAGGKGKDEKKKKASPRKEEEGRDEEEAQGQREQEGEDDDKDSVLNAKHIFDAAFSSPPDPVALQVVEEAADYLGLGCLNLCRVLDPALVLFAGGMSGGGPRFVGMVKERFAAYGWSILPHEVEMGIAALGGEQAGVWGSARAAVMKKAKVREEGERK
jgi:glucokinase